MRNVLLLVITFLALACKKEPTTWDTQYSVPLVKTDMGLDALFPDSLLETDGDQNVSLKFHDEILSFDLDSLLDFQGDTIYKEFSIAPIIELDVNPGITFFTVDDDISFDNIDAQLSLAKIKSGKVIVSATNTIDSDLAFTLSIPKATRNGVSLYLEDIIPHGIDGEMGEVVFEIDLTAYELDLTGENGSDFNLIIAESDISIPADGQITTVYNTDVVSLDLTYKSLEVEYAVGYFGMEHEMVEEGSDFDLLSSISEAILDLDNVMANLSFSNGFGIDLQAYIFELSAWNNATQHNVALDAQFIGNPINLSRGNFDYINIDPFSKNFYLDGSNSNIVEFVELIPDSISLQGKININPLGNISNYNDFASYESKLSADLELEIPLHLSLSNLIVSDTVSFDWSFENPELTQLTLYASAINSFPSEIELSIVALNAYGEFLVDLSETLSPQSSALIEGRIEETAGESLMIYVLDQEVVSLLKEAKTLVIKAHFQTTQYPERVIFQANDHLELTISADMESRIEIK